jgi:hypothetical protein
MRFELSDFAFRDQNIAPALSRNDGSAEYRPIEPLARNATVR